ncbi:heavy-metal-associated domain-containing protein [Clostridium chauvoei]|uniref:HMA domain-containing protein n=2 Tax=Clostridium chauvoei TaxID=46867 RepID=S6EUQ4_9CLOT|nr:heavy-metal-associated domain-containing protein [Clostridium chauvoei]ATD53900.1 ferredoxin [Clostridium chauvoei]ATD58295.1 ferredoxin [Clostridium chauvoei]MBX7280544.1 heavy-metal-associated domain-containing protein [Clostridium chauvoei]MBX7283128.1 heavy-metal-associated domain-containing protein [Clostridium chauvoei]MBX7285342.1 heavy-metal-associated domain-containing protein [Clostridium chauvoei]
MKSSLKVYNLNTQNDIIAIREAISSNEGIIACEVSVSKKEVSIVYDDRVVKLDNIINSLENSGYDVE